MNWLRIQINPHKFLMLIFLLNCFPFLLAQYPAGEEILKKVDENMTAETQKATTTMVIHGRRGSRTLIARSWSAGRKKSFTEYLSPAREKGTKMLMLDDQLWMYSPQTDRTIKIAGHMLRQSMMGSDLSYEDMMENPHLLDLYDAVVTGTDSIYTRECWVLELHAKLGEITYFSRKIWVDKERFIGLREERYAKSGKLLKTIEIEEVFQVNERWYPKKIIFKDVLQKGKGTEFIIDSIEFDINIPEYIFTKASLRK